jgi:hypothetical protein
MFVEACVAQDRLKPAARAVRVLGLTAEFPNIESLYRQRSLARLVGKRLWQVALSFVGSDVGLQVRSWLCFSLETCCVCLPSCEAPSRIAALRVLLAAWCASALHCSSDIHHISIPLLTPSLATVYITSAAPCKCNRHS